MDYLVAGLGNPGSEHARDRHNVGWMVVDELARRHGASFKSKFRGKLADVRVDGASLGLLKPETYMNESGSAIQAAAAFYKVDRGATARRARRRRPARPRGSRRGWEEGSRATTGSARSPSGSERRTSCACGSASAGRSGAILGPSPTTSSPPSTRRTTSRRSSRARQMPSRSSPPSGSTRHSGATTEGSPRGSRVGRVGAFPRRSRGAVRISAPDRHDHVRDVRVA